LREHFAPEAIDDQIEAGKYVVELRHLYDSGKVTIEELEKRLWRLSGELGYPNWLVMLCRNCEYATDIPAFIKPFEEEFAYIAALWENATSSADFLRKYDRTISDTHDVTR
jgi:hypothetical protein